MNSEEAYAADEMMTIAAARMLPNGAVCFVGIGMPSAASNLARLLDAPDVVLVYESGTIGAKPYALPLSIGDGQLSETADTVVSTAEIFSYWLQGGHIDIGFLGAAQIDRFANINTTVIGDYDAPSVRLPGAGGAPEIATLAKEVLVMVRHGPRTFVGELDFTTTPGVRVSSVVTDLGILSPGASGELELTHLHPGFTVDQAIEATEWPLRVATALRTTPPPTDHELVTLRDLKKRG